MNVVIRIACSLVLAATVVAPAAAQSNADPSGHWEGSIRAPFGEIPISLDVWRDATGHVAAAFSRGDGSLTGFPLTNVELNGNDLRLELKANGGGIFRGSLANGTLMGTFAAFAGTVPFDVKRTGDPQIVTVPVNSAISKRLEGTWTARLAAGSEQVTFTMTLANTGTGSATAVIADDHGVNVPLKLSEEGARVAFEIISARGTFTGTMNEGGTEINGTYVEGPLNAPVTFKRVR